MKSNAQIVVMNFIKAINDQDIDEIAELMTKDHIFIDGAGVKHKGKQVMKEGWQKYYELFPDYKIEIIDITVSDSVVGLFGSASGTYKNLQDVKNSFFWKTNAAWKAIVKNNKIYHWQVYCDYTNLYKIIEKTT